MTITSIAADASNTVIYGNNATWSTARTTSSAFELSTVDTHTANSLNGYYIWRSVFKFNTGSIPNGATIISAKIQLTVRTEHSSFDAGSYLMFKKYNWSASDPIDAGNRETAYDGILAAADDATITGFDGVPVGTQLLSNELDKTWINIGGYTYYGLLGNRDYSNTAPTGDDRWYFASAAHATPSYRPQLVIEYSSGINQVIIMA